MPKITQPTSIADLLNAGSLLKTLAARSSRDEQLLIAVRTRLPDPLCVLCIGAVLSEKSLTLFVDSPSWAGRLRFLKEQLQSDLAPLGVTFHQLRVKVYHAPQHKPAGPTHHRASSLSNDNALLIRQSAESVSDQQLRDALLRLSTHHKD